MPSFNILVLLVDSVAESQTYLVSVITLASTVFEKINFSFFPFKYILIKFDLDVK